MSAQGWQGRVALDYRRVGERTVGQDRHEGPLRVLRPLYPEGPGICHHVLVHPPGGVVGGDGLQVQARLAPGAHALLTTPGATRFYRSEGAVAVQQVSLALQDGARLEWLPMETIAYSGCRAENRLRAELAPSAEMIGWDLLALGLAAAGQPFVAGWFGQHLELPGVWLEKARISGDDVALRDSPLGWAGNPVLATLWLARGAPWSTAQRETLLEAARAALGAHALAPAAGVSAVQPSVLVLRVLAPRVEPAMALLAQVRAVWRALLWGLAAEPPRIWRT